MLIDGVVQDVDVMVGVCRDNLLVSEPATGHTPLLTCHGKYLLDWNWLLLTSSDLEMVSLKEEPHSEKVLYFKTSSFLDC